LVSPNGGWRYTWTNPEWSMGRSIKPLERRDRGLGIE
jgi:hypothetical protein